MCVYPSLPASSSYLTRRVRNNDLCAIRSHFRIAGAPEAQPARQNAAASRTAVRSERDVNCHYQSARSRATDQSKTVSSVVRAERADGHPPSKLFRRHVGVYRVSGIDLRGPRGFSRDNTRVTRTSSYNDARTGQCEHSHAFHLRFRLTNCSLLSGNGSAGRTEESHWRGFCSTWNTVVSTDCSLIDLKHVVLRRFDVIANVTF